MVSVGIRLIPRDQKIQILGLLQECKNARIQECKSFLPDKVWIFWKLAINTRMWDLCLAKNGPAWVKKNSVAELVLNAIFQCILIWIMNAANLSTENVKSLWDHICHTFLHVCGFTNLWQLILLKPSMYLFSLFKEKLYTECCWHQCTTETFLVFWCKN